MRLFSILFLIFWIKISSAQVVFSVEVMSDTMQIGDINIYRLKVAHPENVTIRSIDLKPIQIDPLTTERFYQDTSFTNDPQKMAQLDEYFRQQGFSREIMEIQKYGNWTAPNESMMLTGSEANWTTQKNGNQVLKENDIQFTFWEEGIHKILPPTIEYEINGALRTIAANEIQIQVGSPLAQESTPIDSMTVEPIKNVREEPIDFIQDILIPASLLILGFLFLGGIVYLLVKRINGPKIVLPEPKEFVPANVIAINQLEGLKGKQLWQKGDIKTYQSELTHIIRTYLENRYKINALENTTNQIGLDLKKLKLNDELRTEVQNILQVADLVKFAKAKPTDDIHEQFMTKAFEFVETTKKGEAEIQADQEKLETEHSNSLNIHRSGVYKLARIDYRIYASLIDSTILLLHIFFILKISTILNLLGLNEEDAIKYVFLILGIISFILYLFSDYILGGSLGKLIFGMRVFRENTQEKISFRQALNRHSMKTRDIALIFSIGSAVFNKKRKLRHDEKTKTEVVVKIKSQKESRS